MKKLLIILLPIFLLSCNWAVVDKKETQEFIEKAYFEGQRDALDGNVRIRLNTDSSYIWIKSPWDDRTPPIYIPTYLDTKNGN